MSRGILAGVVLALLVGAFVRLAALGEIPLGVQQDELSNIYDGYSILTTGADRFGDRLPVIVRGFGENDYRPALYPWLTVVTQGVTGFSVAAGRLPSAVLGVLSLLLLFVTGRKFAGDHYALAALLFAALAPTHIVYSRLAHEGSVLPGFFVILILYLWQKASLEEYPRWIVALLGIATGLSTNAYQATKLTAFLLAACILIDVVIHSRRRARNVAVFSLTALAGALPQVVALLQHSDRFFARARVLSVTADSPVGWVAEVARNYWLNLEPVYLFRPGETFDLSVARLLTVELPFFYLGLLGLWAIHTTRPSRTKLFIYIAFVVSLLPAAITEGNPNALRGSAFFIIAPLLSAAGVVLVESWLRSESWRRVYFPLVMAVVAANGLALVHWYVTSPVYKEAYYQKVLVDAAGRLATYEDEVDRIIVERYGTQAYIYFAAFRPMHPREFQQGPRSSYSIGMDEFTALGKYRFVPAPQIPRAIAEADSAGLSYLVVSPRKLGNIPAVDTVSYWNDTLFVHGKAATARRVR